MTQAHPTHDEFMEGSDLVRSEIYHGFPKIVVPITDHPCGDLADPECWEPSKSQVVILDSGEMTLTLTANDVAEDVLRLMMGLPVALPLCRQQIPAEGTE